MNHVLIPTSLAILLWFSNADLQGPELAEKGDLEVLREGKVKFVTVL
jgi:hypothetical protein